MSLPLSLSAIQARVNKLAAIIDAKPNDLPTYGTTRDFGYRHVESDTRYHLVVVERGLEIDRKSTDSIDELLFWIFDSATFNLACDFEMHHRKVGEDFRKQLFSKQIDLMSALSPDWTDRLRDKIRSTLRSVPFNGST